MSTNNNQTTNNKEVKPKWKNNSETATINKLSGSKLQSLVQNDLAECTALTLSGRGITKMEDFFGFSTTRLHRVDLSNNAITRLQGFASVTGISMLNISSNSLAGDASLEDLRYPTLLQLPYPTYYNSRPTLPIPTSLTLLIHCSILIYPLPNPL